LSLSEHPHHFNRISWEGLYVALSRVKLRDDVRLLLRNGDLSTMKYISDLKKNPLVKAFLRVMSPKHPKTKKEKEAIAKEAPKMYKYK
jgi:hypothetical protein